MPKKNTSPVNSHLQQFGGMCISAIITHYNTKSQKSQGNPRAVRGQGERGINAKRLCRESPLTG